MGLSVLFAVGGGGDTGVVLEVFAEEGLIVKVKVYRDLLNGHIGGLQQYFRFHHYIVCYPVACRSSGYLFDYR